MVRDTLAVVGPHRAMTLDLTSATQYTQWLLAIGIVLQSVESLVACHTFGFRSVFVLRLMLALVLLAPISSLPSAAVAGVHLALLLTSMLLVARLRGPLCGGSDAMFFQVQLGLLLVSLESLHPLLPRLGLGWIAAQSVLSYFLAGWVKLRNPRWRNGTALRNLLESEGPYVLWQPARALARSPAACVAASWMLIGFEILFPLVLVLAPPIPALLLAAGLLFHLGNALLLGLNRFVWAWAATYPALLYF